MIVGAPGNPSVFDAASVNPGSLTLSIMKQTRRPRDEMLSVMQRILHLETFPLNNFIFPRTTGKENKILRTILVDVHVQDL